MSLSKKTLKHFLSFFPLIELPVSITDDSHHDFGIANKPLSEGAIQAVFLDNDEEFDEFTEIVPCFQVKHPEGLHVVVYWKVQLLDHHYYVMVMDKKGDILSKTSIAGERSDGEKIARMMATIDRDLVITMIAGEEEVSNKLYDPSKSKAFEAEILEDGNILFSENEKLIN